MDEVHAALTRRWLAKAANDLRAADLVSAAPDGPLDTAIYHCQQAAEKAVKGFLIFRDEPFEKTHDIVRVVRLAERFEPTFETLVEQARLLTPLAWQFRYPSEVPDDEPTRAQFEEALREAHEIYNFVLRLLPVAAHP